MPTNQMGLASKSKLTAIANAIREKLGVPTQYSLDDMPTAIASISDGGGGASWVTVAEQTLAEDAAEIVFSEISGTYDVYEIALVGKTSAVEWIYPIFTSSGSKTNYISANGTNGLSTFNTTLLIAKVTSGTVSQYCIPLRSGGSINISQKTSALNYLKLGLYNSGSKFKSGFTVAIRGMNYPN